MKKQHILAALTLITVSGLVWAGADKATFQNLDTNNDGQITLDEANKSSEVKARFTQADANKDGRLDAAEFSALEAIPKESPMEIK
ncbi:hypothetical protein SCL_2478 [Sulfuricaulis limicola]|uniref:EF-hand domain-containing protein n=1 Tax=Sulfuricaulis limicola TaxID=1620215 RepID=A0A1B4XIX0_9GAMM|nr:hypothetical protein [Sulfuricaulis limicola]BAV34755.1 hypothetical protein SCL_2478 [Sulfuricaulis limicola]